MSHQAGPVFAALADPTRRRLVELLAGGKANNATELAKALPITRQGVSKHLAVLEHAGLIAGRQVGREKHYQFRPEPLEEPLEWITRITQQWDQRLEKLRDYLREQDNAQAENQEVKRLQE
ncbi:MAG: ArsR/SmtB family transcription factor [Anaerolineales bacterium]|jgi:DNA-binding transcriptional ArsR family regulator